jgi:DNA-directed RNA polymerase specialized sigma24 family protein
LQALRQLAKTLAPETLVYVIREAIRTGDATEVMQICSRGLQQHAERVIRWVDRAKFGFHESPDLFSDYCEASLDSMWDGIMAGTEGKPYWEENFGQALFGKCIDVGRPLYRRQLTHISLEALPEDPGQDGVRDAFQKLQQREVQEAIRRLPPDEADAIQLHYIEGRRVDSPKPGSVRNIMGKSASRIHELLAQGRRRLASDPVMRGLHDTN